VSSPTRAGRRQQCARRGEPGQWREIGRPAVRGEQDVRGAACAEAAQVATACLPRCVGHSRPKVHARGLAAAAPSSRRGGGCRHGVIAGGCAPLDHELVDRLEPRRTAVMQEVGVDVGLERTSIGVVDQAGAVVWRGRRRSQVESIAAVVRAKAPAAAAVGAWRPARQRAGSGTLALAWPAAAEPAGGLPGRPRCRGGARPPGEPDRRQRRLRARATGAQRLVPRGRAQAPGGARLQCLLRTRPI
jgi:hypothetical protein